jgi:hypothetical protein
MTNAPDMLKPQFALTTHRALPPDPEGLNNRRADWAQQALEAFQDVTGIDDEYPVDLLADLMHWCDRNGCDFDVALERARYHYEAETRQETV